MRIIVRSDLVDVLFRLKLKSLGSKKFDAFQAFLRGFAYKSIAFFLLYIISLQAIVLTTPVSAYSQNGNYNLRGRISDSVRAVFDSGFSKLTNSALAVIEEIKTSTGDGIYRLISDGSGNDSVSSERITNQTASSNQPANTNALSSITIFGPKRFNRTHGAPNQYQETFSMPANCAFGTFQFIVRDGNPDGTNRNSSATISLNGTEIFTQSDFNQNVYELAKTVTLQQSNTINIRLQSTPGSFITIEVIGQRCDDAPPTIIITSPPDNTATTAQSVNLTGTAEDAGIDASGIAGVWVNDVPAVYNPADGTWSFENFALAIGPNVIVAKTVDNVGYEASTQITVIRDLTNPTIFITEPSDGMITEAATITVNGTASDSGMDASQINRVTVNGANAVYDPVSSNWIFENFALNVGSNTITAIAYDNAGNQASEEISVTRVVNQPPTANAGADQTIELPDGVSLTGAATDDGYPIGSSLLYSWSKLSGDGDVSFSNPGNLQTTANFSASGIYVLRLSVTDGQYTATDDVQITVYPENQAPTVNAGVDQTIDLPNTANLSGSTSDDGYPVGSNLTVSWSKISGNGDVIFANSASPATTASFSSAGTYILRLTATDGRLSSNDEVTITVNPENQSPVVNAGQDQTIILPNTANLNGTVTDDGYPQGSSLTTSWSKTTGDGTVTFSDSTSLTTTASFSQAGVYTLQLNAFDGQLYSSDELIVTVIDSLTNAVIILEPERAGPNPINSTQTINAVIKNQNNQPIPNITVTFTVTGANAGTYLAVSDAAGIAAFSYSGTSSGTDTVTAIANSGNTVVNSSNTSTVNWIAPIQTISTTPVLARFFRGGSSGTFDIPAGQTPVFTQYFPTVNFNPEPNRIPNNTSGVNTYTHPMVNVTTDYRGFYTGTITVEGNGYQAGVGQLLPSAATFSGEFIVSAPGTITFNFYSDDGFYFGVGNGATRVSGANTNLPASGLTAYKNLPIMGGYNRPTAPSLYSVTVNFPSAGIYPYEVDWADCCLSQMAMTITNNATGFGIPPVNSIALSPNSALTKTIGQQQTFTATVTDASGNPVINKPITLDVVGVNARQLVSMTNSSGIATFTFAGFIAGNDTVQALGQIDGIDALSNKTKIKWNSTTNQRPTVNAGADQTITYPASANLNGQATDDGLPNGNLTISWSKVSGAGNVTFTNPNSAQTTADFSTTGTYVLRLTASDGNLSATDDVTVSVIPQNYPPVVSAGEDKLVALPNKSFQFIQNNPTQFNQVAGNPSIAVDFDSIAAGTDITGQTYNGILFEKGDQPAPSAPLIVVRGADTFTPTGFSGVINAETNKLIPATGQNVLSPGGTELAPGLNNLKENDDLKLTFTEPVAAVGFDILFQEYDFFSAVSIKIYDPQGVILYQNGNLPVSTGAGGGAPGGREFFGFVSTRSNIKTIVIDEFDNNNVNPDSNIGFSGFRIQKVLPNTFVSLNGSVTDDGLPIGGTLTSAWSLVSGPGTVSFSNINSPTTPVTFSEAGTYVLRLTANDGELEAFDEVTITAYNNGQQPTNQPPNVNAGQDQTITLPNSVNLFGFVTDDGLPTGSSVSVSWSKISGPGNVNFSSANSVSTNASFSQPGAYILRLTATDTAQTSFDDVSITVLDATATNQPPIVFAGNDATTNLNTPVALNGTASDDGLPTGSVLTFGWSKVSGPGTVAFSNPSALQTNASISAEGVYTLRLTASDGQLSSSDDVVITVNPAQQNQAPTANAGNDKTVKLNGNLVLNGSAEDDLTGGAIPDWNVVSGNSWTRLQGGAGTTPFARFGEYVFSPGTADTAEITQDIDVRAYSVKINDGTQEFNLQVYLRSLAETTPDAGRVLVEYRDQANLNTIATLNTGEISSVTDWFLIEDTRVPPAGTGFIRIHLIAVRKSGLSNDVFFDGISFKAVGGGAAVKLDGTATDDNLPAGNTLQTVWSKVSGSGNVVFSNANSASSAAYFDTAGTYVLRLTANDGEFTATDEVTVTVGAANQPPVVNAGADATVNTFANLTLNGSATDDGGNLNYRWVKVSGPGNVSINDGRIANPTVSFQTAGTYVLRLIVEDGELEASDDVTITVNPAPANQPPTVDAGQNQSISFPNTTATLNGTATDDGLPNPLTINWSKTSGPGNVTFANPNSAQTAATFDAVGTYVLRLTVSDGQYTAYDEMAVFVNPENLPPTVNAGADQTIMISQTAVLQGEASDDGLPAGGSFSALWTKVSGDGNVNFSNPNQTGTYATFSQTGTYILRLTVSDSQLSASDDVTVTVIENIPPPTADITITDGASVTEPIAVTGTISEGSWRLEYSLTDTDNPNSRVWTTVASGTGAASGNLGTLDTTLMMNGLYDVRVVTTDTYGRTVSDTVSVSVENNLKVGHFTVSFEDMNVPVAGIPMQVIRTYDSRDKRKGDFGIGWTLGIKNVRVEKNNILGLRWYQTTNGAAFPTYCVEATRPHIITVTMPDGEVEKFEAKLERECQQFAPLSDGRIKFVPQAGTRGTLSITGDNSVYIAGSVPGPVELYAYDSSGIFDRTQFKYTAKDGTEFVINQGASGLQSVRDTDGNTLTISTGGITHSSGASISFTRDAQGRITQITDPNGVSNTYTYDTNGDLVSYTDRGSNTTSFTYEPTIAHHLKSIVDPLGRTPIRNDYDASGRLLKHTDSSGNEIVYTHNLAARIETVTDRLGNATVYQYDNRGNVLVKRDALGNETNYTYDANDNVLTETNALGKTTVYTYDQFDNRTSVTDALGNRTEMTYNSRGLVLTVKDARNNVTTNTYNAGNNLLTTTDALGNVTTNTYSSQTGKLTSTRDALNNVTSFEYTGNYLTKETDAQGNITNYAYDANGNRRSQTVRRTNAAGQTETITTNFEYDNLNRLTKTTYPDGTFTRTEYNELGQQTATVDQAGNRTEFLYDALGRLTRTTYPDGTFEESTFDAEGRRLTSKDRLGRITAYEYDALGRLKKTTYSDGTFTQTNYDAAGQVVSSTDARGNSTVYTYDDAGRRLTIKNALDQITSFAYDANGNQSSMTDALGRSTAFVYDALNRKTRTNFADSSFTETTFDALGRRTIEKDQAGKQTQFVYDSLGRLTKVIDALSQETRFEYNELGQQTKQFDALGRTTRYEYDQLGRRTKRILPLGQTETYAYDTRGNLQSKTDFNGKTTAFAYDNMRRLLSKTPDPSLNQTAVSFTYNALGLRETMTDASGTTNYLYDSRNRLQHKATPNGTLSYGYDENGNIKTVRSSNANGTSIDYNYDELSRLQTVKDNRLTGNQTTAYTYDAVGNLESYSYPNQVVTSYGYNNLNRLTAMTIANASNSLASYSYTLGAAGNRTQVTEGNGRTVNYVYDDLYRLTSETIANSSNNGQIVYQYDAVGNRLQRTSSVNQVANQSSTFDANDRLNSDSYDDNGNTKISNGRQFNYDFENKLTSTNDGITIVYDGDGNRVSKTVNGVTTNYLVDTNNLTGYAQVVEELQNGQIIKAYTYGHDLISQRQSSGVSFYNYDGHGSVRKLTDNLGQVTDTYDYDAFGNLINRTGTTDNNYLYAGEQFDADLGFYYNRARYLNVQTGRFISQDTYEGKLSDPLSLHKYLYAHGDGVNKIDPSGNFMSLAEAALVVTVATIIATMSSCTFIQDNFNKPITVQMRWDTAFQDFNSSNSLNSAEIQEIKSTAKTEFEKAYRGFNVKIDESAERKIIINDDWGSGTGTSGGSENGSTRPLSAISFVYYSVLKFGINQINSKMSLNKSRSELVHGLGQGIGATAAHELGHQVNLEYISHTPTQGYYDSKETTVEGGGDSHFFGQLKWTPEALEKMNRVLLRSK